MEVEGGGRNRGGGRDWGSKEEEKKLKGINQ